MNSAAAASATAPNDTAAAPSAAVTGQFIIIAAYIQFQIVATSAQDDRS